MNKQSNKKSDMQSDKKSEEILAQKSETNLDKKSDKKIQQKIGQEISPKIGQTIGQKIRQKIGQKYWSKINKKSVRKINSWKPYAPLFVTFVLYILEHNSGHSSAFHCATLMRIILKDGCKHFNLMMTVTSSWSRVTTLLPPTLSLS